MTTIEEMDRGAVDFSDVVSGRQLPLVHPGEILRDEFLTPMKCSVYRLKRPPIVRPGAEFLSYRLGGFLHLHLMCQY